MKLPFLSGTSGREMPQDSVRLIISQKGMNLKLLKIQHIAAKAPLSDKFPDRAKIYGSWIEVRSLGGEMLYFKCINCISDNYVEIVTGDSGEKLSFQMAQGVEKIRVHLVPALKDADHLVIFNRKPESMKEDAIELARFSVKF